MKTVIEMARESWLDTYGLGKDHFSFVEALERFAKLVRADERLIERKKWMQVFIDPENQPSQFGTVTVEYVQREIEAEREACAKVCDEQVERSKVAMEKSKRTTDHAVYRAGAQTAEWNAAAIRARSKDEK